MQLVPMCRSNFYISKVVRCNYRFLWVGMIPPMSRWSNAICYHRFLCVYNRTDFYIQIQLAATGLGSYV